MLWRVLRLTTIRFKTGPSCIFLPRQDFQPSITDIQQWLTAWGIDQVDAAIAFSRADEWDDDELDLLADQSDLSLEELAGFLSQDGLTSAHVLLDPGPCGLVSMMREIAAGCRQQWTPCAVTITWGPRSIPDLMAEQTAARCACSLIVGGDGAPWLSR